MMMLISDREVTVKLTDHKKQPGFFQSPAVEFDMVETKRIELSTLRMRTVRSPS